MTRRFILPTVCVIALGAALSGGDPGGGGSGPGRLAAIVNGEKIWSSQVESLLAQGGRAAPEALERVIDQELLAQAAREAGIERDPAVMAAIESARRRILGEAWLERAAAGDARRRAEVEQFYRDNPALFRERRIYRVLEVAAAAPREMLPEITKAAANAASLTDVAAWLEARRVPFNVSTASRPAEQIPLHILPQVAGMRDGQIAVFPTSRGASIVQLLRSSERPVTEREAAPLIERYLASRRRLDLALAEMRRLRGQAVIEYFGDYRPLPPGAGQPAMARRVLAGGPAGAGTN